MPPASELGAASTTRGRSANDGIRCTLELPALEAFTIAVSDPAGFDPFATALNYRDQTNAARACQRNEIMLSLGFT